MFMKTVFFLMILFLSITSYSQEEDYPKLSVEQAIQDIDFLENLIFDTHISLDIVCDTQDLKLDFVNLREGINDSISAAYLFSLMAPVFYQIKDVHCALSLPLESNNYYQNDGLYLPISVYMQDSGMYVIEDYFDTLPSGARILKINETASEVIMTVLKSVVGSDGDNSHTRELLAAHYFANFYPLFYSVDSINTITYVYENDTMDMLFESVQRNKYIYDRWFDKQFEAEENPFRFGYSEDINSVYLKVASFIGGSYGEYQRFLRHSFTYIHAYNPDCLILDLRDNPGGFSHRGKLLTRFLMPKPYSYVQNIVSKSSDIIRDEILRENPLQPEIVKFMYRTFSNKPLRTMWNTKGGHVDTIKQKEVKPIISRLRYNNLLIVLMNGMSASTSGLVLNTLRKRPNTIFIGQPAACTDDGTFGQPVSFQLPNSGIYGQISILRFNQKNEPLSMNPIIPDILVKPNMKDFFDGHDTQLQYVIDFLISKKTTQ